MIDLATLIAPLDTDDFLSGHWPDKAYWTNGGRERLEGLRDVPELESPESALTKASLVQVFRPDGKMAAVENGEKALPLYRLGFTCYLGSKHIPALKESAERLSADLGLPSGSIVCEVFCSSGDNGAWMHSDMDVNFALLLSGKKRWRIAPNEYIRNQTSMCVPSTRDAPDPLQLELADKTPFPERMPDDSLEIEVEAGDLVFLPRGWWHETQPSGECLQVNFCIQSPTWMEVLTKALSERLMRDPQWRAYAVDVFGPPARREEALRRFAELLPGLRDHVDELLSTDDPEALAAEIVERSGFRPAAQLANTP